jgi:hypothetical protein
VSKKKKRLVHACILACWLKIDNIIILLCAYSNAAAAKYLATHSLPHSHHAQIAAKKQTNNEEFVCYYHQKALAHNQHNQHNYN